MSNKHTVKETPASYQSTPEPSANRELQNLIAGNPLIDNLSLWTSTTKAKSTSGRGINKKIELEGIKKLRELILELAVRGKLVPQNPEDEPASKLLKRIEVEKARLIKEGKLKKQKPLAPVNDDKKPFELPMGWQWVKLGAIAKIFNGNSVSANDKIDKYCQPNDIPYIATKDIGYGFAPINYNNGVFIPYNEKKFKLVESGSVLMCAEGGSAGKKCGITSQTTFFGNKLFAAEPYKEINKEIILFNYLCPYFYTSFSEKMTGIIGGISIAKFINLEIPIPPYSEQIRIIEEVNRLINFCDQLEINSKSQLKIQEKLIETLLTKLSESKETNDILSNWARLEENFDMLFSGGLTNTTGLGSGGGEWTIDRLKECILQLAFDGKLFQEHYGLIALKNCLEFGPRNGFSPRNVEAITNLRVLKLGATTTGKLLIEESKYISENHKIDNHLRLREGDILIQRGNSSVYVGSNILVTEDHLDIIYPDLMMKIRVNENWLPKYISMMLSSPKARQHMWSHMNGTSSTMPKINKRIVENAPIPIASLEQQHRIVAKVDELFALCDQLKARLQAASETQLTLTEALVEQALN
jgi:type I restriction enzyme S subunit